MLEKVLGPGQAIVRVAADINFDTIQRTEEKFDPDGQVIRTETKDESNEDSSTASNNEAAGIAANTPGNSNLVAQSGAPVTNTKNKKITGTTEYEISKSTSNILQGAGGIKRLSAAVTVAAQYEGTGADRKVVPRTPEELENSSASSAARWDTDYNPRRPNHSRRTALQRPVRNRGHPHSRHPGTAGLLVDPRPQCRSIPALALVDPGDLFAHVQGALPLTISPSAFLSAPAAGHGNGNGNGNGHRPGYAALGQAKTRQVVTVEVLNQLIKENPQNMTQAIRSWLDRGSLASKMTTMPSCRCSSKRRHSGGRKLPSSRACKSSPLSWSSSDPIPPPNSPRIRPAGSRRHFGGNGEIHPDQPGTPICDPEGILRGRRSSQHGYSRRGGRHPRHARKGHRRFQSQRNPLARRPLPLARRRHSGHCGHGAAPTLQPHPPRTASDRGALVSATWTRKGRRIALLLPARASRQDPRTPRHACAPPLSRSSKKSSTSSSPSAASSQRAPLTQTGGVKTAADLLNAMDKTAEQDRA